MLTEPQVEWERVTNDRLIAELRKRFRAMVLVTSTVTGRNQPLGDLYVEGDKLQVYALAAMAEQETRKLVKGGDGFLVHPGSSGLND